MKRTRRETTGKRVIDHDTIRRWVKARGGLPARLRSGAGAPGALALAFDEITLGEALERISWDEFFDRFDRNNLALCFDEQAGGSEHGCRIVGR